MQQVSLEELNAGTRAAFIDALGDIFEHSPWVAEAAAGERPFPTLAALYARLSDALLGAGAEQQLAVIKAHPDLAGKAARAGALTRESTAEQASAGLDRLSDEEYATFHRLNEAYKQKFGFPFIIGVRRHTKDSILDQIERRRAHDIEAERNAALREILRIVALRLDQRVRAPDRLPVHGRLSTHVLDNFSGRPAQGVAIELFEVSKTDERRLVTSGVTNHDGRTDGPLISDRPLPIGRYELRFAVGAYYAALKASQADPPFLDVVPVRFAMAEPEGHYHVPLLCTPWSYTTYRGS
ncbi:MAG: 2-oxo-4-hydroxy-4-carboxy-5-ureidoimidazoline decarboxylase [Xanthobacteraceae bacterium]|nr:2-oxo-4-hydroxy-4-carboxy-5-ureidoimidazoline decarboxylase [Xanthobacteraceae bacterium]MBV9631400.1 2-oxo-4-hydroxy-4-carboxy-5-ureidoimidazoline decarboxylase [Xanthobacteraceae bacterium]